MKLLAELPTLERRIVKVFVWGMYSGIFAGFVYVILVFN
jgi:hypothetical protein